MGEDAHAPNREGPLGEDELSEIKEKILEIVHYIIEKKRLVKIETLLRHARRSTKAPREVIEGLIDQLILEKKIVPGSRITRKIILQNSTREKIYSFIKKFPGANINTIKKSLKLGPNALYWHLGVLMKFGCIQELLYRSSKLFAHHSLNPLEVFIRIFLRKGVTRRILTALSDGPCTLSDIKKRLTSPTPPKSTLAYNLNLLEELELVKKNEKVYTIMEPVLPYLQEVLA
ncbi:MAG: helix-turn-helix domain-containing protein [Promethearchaeota archaeon]